MKRTGPPCSICSHPKRTEIDADGRGQVRVAEKYGIAASSLQRHRQHASKAPPSTVEKGEAKPPTIPPPTTEREALLDALAKAKHGLSRTETEDMPRLLNAITGISKRLAQLDEERDISETDIAQSAAWRALLSRLQSALAPYPDAARAMARALTEAA